MKMGLFNEDVNSLEQSQARQLYYSGKAAMAAEGSWIIGNFINETTPGRPRQDRDHRLPGDRGAPGVTPGRSSAARAGA